MLLFWGQELIQFYNDAFRPSLGNNGKHHSALGQRGEECWQEIWSDIKPLIDHVLTAFARLNSKDKYEGTGLCLALCKKIVERHHGSIQAASIKDEGGTFTILLPLQQPTLTN